MEQETTEIWMTLKQIQEAGATLHPKYLYRLVSSGGMFTTRHAPSKGRPLEVLMTPDVISRLKIKGDIDFRGTSLKTSSSQVVIHTGTQDKSKDYTVSSDADYDYGNFASLFRAVLPDEPNPAVLEELFEKNAGSLGEKINGGRLIGLLLEAREAAFLGKTLFDYISREAGVNIGEVSAHLSEVAGNQIRKLSPRISYILKGELPGVIEEIRKHAYPGIEDSGAGSWPSDIDLRSKPVLETRVAVEQTPQPAGFYISVPGYRVKEVVRKGDGLELIVESIGPATREVLRTYEPSVSLSGKSVRLTATDLAKLTGLSVFTMRKRMTADKDSLNLKRRTEGTGCAYEAEVTRDNYHLLGITKEQAESLLGFEDEKTAASPAIASPPLPLTPVPHTPVPHAPSKPFARPPAAPVKSPPTPEEQPVEVVISERPYQLFPSRMYTPNEVGELLRQVNQAVFSDVVVERIFQELEIKDGQMEGRDLVRYVHRVNGMMDLSSSSTKSKLAQMGISLEALEEPRLSEYVRKAPGLREHYVLKRDLPRLQELCSGRRPPGPTDPLDPGGQKEQERLAALRKWEDKLTRQNIMPRDLVLRKLRDAGVFVDNSAQTVEATYGAFETQMKGFVYFDLGSLRAKVDPSLSWQDFRVNYLNILEERGFVKDVVAACGGTEDKWVYVLKKGTTPQQLHRVLGLPS